MDWMGLKGLAADVGLEKDALHIYAAVVIQLGAAFALRRPLSSWLPWACVLIAALFNEFLDVWFGEESAVQAWQIAGATHDMVNTMVMPTIFLLLGRYGRAVLGAGQTEPEEPDGSVPASKTAFAPPPDHD